MRRPGGYGQLICFDASSAIATDRHGRRIEAEHDTSSCGHCGVVTFVNAYERPEDIGGMCKGCMRHVCPECHGQIGCKVIEKRIEEMERREDARRSYEF